jgi:hypothetical protein
MPFVGGQYAPSYFAAPAPEETSVQLQIGFCVVADW